ncbi:MAG: VWA domain-containing protein [Cytophagales bacterium]|nr:VWA domain-containing protein [Bernardetiaceae bacterium]MDW8205215.1 VWA domain-containing protein [Cytophagales bacterium]
MQWFSNFGITETVLIAAFLLLYGLYILRSYQLAKMLQTHARRVWIKFALRATYFSLLIISLLGPSFGELIRKEVKSVGKDIYIAVDLSLSMNATDIQPSRLAKVKFELKRLVDNLVNDRIGLIIFSTEAFIQCPLTYDRSAIYTWIESLKTSLMPNTGTDFAQALALAHRKLTDTTEVQKKIPQSKMLILFSDGEDFGEQTQEIVNKFEQDEIRIFTVGVGTTQGSKIPFRDNSFKRDLSGREVITKLNTELLQSIAEQTGGRYFEINDNTVETSRLIETINQIEGELMDKKQMDITANNYAYFLFVAILLVITDVLFTVNILRI